MSRACLVMQLCAFMAVASTQVRAQAQSEAPAERTALTSGLQGPTAGPRARRGTHFIVEGSLGLGLSRSPSFHGAATFGGGGRVPGTPLRGYLLFSVAGHRATQDALGSRRVRFDTFFGVGARLYVAPLPALRLYGELLGGAQRAVDTVSPPVGRNLHVEGYRPELRAGFGFQVRPIEALSIGLGVTRRAFEDEYEQVAASEGLRPLTRWIGHATTTWHF